MFKSNVFKRIVVLLLSITVIIGCFPVTLAYADSVGVNAKVVDESTYDGWKDFFKADTADISTENSGGIWTDKSVFSDNSKFASAGVTQNNNDNFLVALSAVTSNMTITGQSNMPTDTVLVLDASGSMNKSNNNCAKQLIDAANESIYELMKLNKYNRVAVVIYSGLTNTSDPSPVDSAVLLLPLDRYSNSVDADSYLTYTLSGSSEIAGVDSNLKSETTGAKPSTSSRKKTFVGATYTQRGIMLGLQEFMVADTVVDDAKLGTLERMPIMVLMSDGVPTTCSTSFADPFNSDSKGHNMGNGTNSRATDAMGFVTQLSASYAKSQINGHYSKECLFYTVSLGLDSSKTEGKIALSVMDPKKSTETINGYWQNYSDAAIGDTITVTGKNGDGTKVKKIAELEKDYVELHFPITGNSSQMQSGLTQAFQSIIKEITNRSKYFPNLSSVGGELSDSVTFVDEIGQYMRIDDVKGILVNNKLLSGADVANTIVNSATAVNAEIVNAIKERFNISDSDKVTELINQAVSAGQIKYDSKNSFSNYIGWYANAAGEFLDFYNEGVTVLPAATGDVAKDPAMIVKSYIYLGEADTDKGITAADMLLTAVYVREDIKTKNQTVLFSVPEKLLPSILYDVELDSNGNPTDINVTGATEPIALVYEVGLDSKINAYNIKEKVSSDYLLQNTNSDGSINFYTNDFNLNQTSDYKNTVNTYTYFQPALNNDRYYYAEDTLIYSNVSGAVYESDVSPEDNGGKFYRRQVVYQKTGNILSKDYVYYELSAEEVDKVVASSTPNQWVIPAGTVNVEHEHYLLSKVTNQTSSLSFFNKPFMDYENPENISGKDYYTFGAFLGNNGKMSFVPETGIKLSKALSADAVDTSKAFEFKLNNTTNRSDNSSYNAYKINSDGTTQDTSVNFINDNATVYLKPGETLYIGSMTVGDVISVTEVADGDYVVDSVNSDVAVKDLTTTIIDKVMGNASFVNRDRSKGSLSIFKEVNHNLGTGYIMPEKNFDFELTLTGAGSANVTFSASKTNEAITSVKTDSEGKYSFSLKDNEQLLISDIPEGVTATVTEKNIPQGFTPEYSENGVAGDGSIYIAGNVVNQVKVSNNYSPANVTVGSSIKVNGEKVLSGRSWKNSDEFIIKLERQTVSGWETVAEKHIFGSDSLKKYSFDNEIAAEEFTAVGEYNYRITEKNNGIGGIAYDNTVHSFTIYVTDTDMDGALEIGDVDTVFSSPTNISKSGSVWSVTGDFQNRYSVSGNTVVNLSGAKTLENKSLANGEFTFELYETDASFIVGSTPVKTAVNTDGRFNISLSFADSDVESTHYYVLSEKNSGETISGIKYSDESYKITVNVKDDTLGGIKAEVTAESKNGTVNINELDFTNKYQAEKVTVGDKITLSGEKLLNGRSWKSGDTFDFKLEKQIGSNWTELGTVSVSGANVSKAFDFNALISAEEYSTIGVYSYRVTEVGGTIAGLSYDATVHIFDVEVTDNDFDGKLEINNISTNSAPATVVSKSGSIWNIGTNFTNTYTVSGSDTIELSGDTTLLNKPLQDGDFTLELCKTDSSFAVSGTPYKTAVNSAGTFSITLDYSAADVGNTYYYVLRETNAGNTVDGVSYSTEYYKISVTVTDDTFGGINANISVMGMNGAVGSDELDFVNVYAPQSITAGDSLAVSGEKTLSGRTWKDSDSFTFKLEKQISAGWKILGTDTVNGTDTLKEFDLSSIISAEQYDTVGDYTYRVTETNGSIGGVDYDATSHVFTVKVTDKDLDGYLEIDDVVPLNPAITNMTRNGNKWIVKADFTNTYSVSGNALVTFGGEKILLNKPMANGDFTFELYKTDASFALSGVPYKTTVNTDGKFEFTENYSATDAGNTYYYVVKEANAGSVINGVTYSAKIYNVTVDVADDTFGGIVASAVATDENGIVSINDMDFLNTYKAAEVSVGNTINILGENLLSGRQWKDDDTFTFRLERQNGTEWVELGTDTVTGADIDKSFDLSTILSAETYDREGVYVYRITEVVEIIPGVGYDVTEHTFAVVVTDTDKDGYLEISSVNADTSPSTNVSEVAGVWTVTADFNNTYLITGSDTVVLSGTKTLNNHTMEDGEFTFELYETDSSFTMNSLPLRTAFNDNGKFIISLDYTSADIGNTYYYVLREKNTGETINGITYSDAEYKIAINVEDNTIGGVKATATVEGGNGSTDVDKLDFVNNYCASPAITSLSGKKVLQGRDIAENEFRFRLYTADSNYIIDDTVPYKEASNKADSTFTFADLTFNDAGTYYFVVAEDNTVGLERMTYDSTLYNVKIDVKDDGIGHLIAGAPTVYVAGNTETADEIIFNNVFIPKPENINVIIGVNKVVDNLGTKILSPEGFTFILEKDGTDEKYSVCSDENGNGEIVLTFSEDDIGNTYTYTFTEINDGRDYVSYSTDEHIITVSVSLNSENKLVADLTLDGNVTEEVIAEFVNVYDYTPVNGSDGSFSGNNSDGSNNGDSSESDGDSSSDGLNGSDSNNSDDNTTSGGNATSSGSVSGSNGAARTGDTANVSMWLAVFFVSCLGVVTLNVYKRKEELAEE